MMPGAHVQGRRPARAAAGPCTVAGGALLAAAWIGPLPAMAAHAFAAHMALHLIVIAAAAPMLALGLAGGRFDPVRRFPLAFSPLVASIVDLVVVWGWHVPGAHAFARQTNLGFAAEQASFLAAGFMLWISIAGGTAAERRARAGAGVLALLLTSMHMTLLGVLLTMAPRVLYEHAAAGGNLEDQQLGGLLMLAGAGSVYVLGGIVVMAWLLRGADARPQGGGA